MKLAAVGWFEVVCGGISLVAGIVAAILIYFFAAGTNVDNGYMGGLNWSNNISNWHPVFMVWGMVLCFSYTILLQRVEVINQRVSTALRYIFLVGTLLLFSLGLFTMAISKNNLKYASDDAYNANFYSLHSLLGLIAITLVVASFLFTVGVIDWIFPFLKRAIVLGGQVVCGFVAVIAVTGAVETGLMENNTQSGCTYNVTGPDYNPAENYHLLPQGCRLGNGIGILILISLLFTILTVLDSPVKLHQE